MHQIQKVNLRGQELEDRLVLLSNLLTARGKRRFLAAVEAVTPGDPVINSEALTMLWRDAFLRAGRATSSVGKVLFEFDPTHPRAVRMMREAGASLVKDITGTTQGTLQTVISQGMRNGHSTDQLAALVKQNVGLLPRHVQAVDRYQRNLLAKGYPRGVVQARVHEYRERLLDYRAEMIARTEVQKALEAGKLEVWKQAAEVGVIRRGESWRVWNLDPNCNHCEHCPGISKKRARIGGVFYTGLGPVEGPPLHPNCCCFTTLEAPMHLEDARARR